MSNDELKQLMVEWGGFPPLPGQAFEENLIGFAKAVESAEREACAMVLRRKYDELANRSYPPPKILLELEGAILERSNAKGSGAPIGLR